MKKPRKPKDNNFGYVYKDYGKHMLFLDRGEFDLPTAKSLKILITQFIAWAEHQQKRKGRG